MDPITKADVLDAVEQLANSRIGLNALRRLLAWLDEDGLGLDATNQVAVLTILDGAWGQFAGSARDFMREYL